VSPEEWPRAKEILDAAMDLPAHERSRYIAERCGTDTGLQRDIESLLTACDPNSRSLIGGLGPAHGGLNRATAGLSIDRTVTAHHQGISHSLGPGDATPHPRLAPGSAMGPYAIGSLLGVGGMGEVYLARDTRLDRDVAIKLLQPAFASHPDRRRRFEQEARTAASLSHPNIVAVYDVGLNENVPFIVMEYVRGETLSSQLRRERFSRGRALQIGGDIAAALVEAHAHHIAHRDLKPGNVMLTPEGMVKVLDFGIAKTIASGSQAIRSDEPAPDAPRTRPGQLVGTPGYMSPEQRTGGHVDERTDVYSLGVILFELFTGRRPFAQDDFINASATTPVLSVRALDPSVPQALGELIAQAMDWDPAARPSAAGLRADLNALALRAAFARPDVPSVAVLSFSDMSERRDQEFFCDGMAEELINALTQIAGLRVAARTSAFQFKGKSRDVRAIGDALNVGAVLDGSVRKSGKRLRITVDLIGTADGYQLWSERFERDLEDVFAVQDEIVRSVIGVLKGKLFVDKAAPAIAQHCTNVDAYGFYLEGRYHWNKRTETDLKKSVKCFELAIAQDAQYARAYVGLADAYVTLATYGVQPAREVIPRAKEALDRALDIDADLAQAYACRGCARSVYDWAWADAEHDFRRAIALNAWYPTAHHWYAINHLVPLGRFAEATDELLRALELDPLALAIKTSLGMKDYFANHYDEAARALLKTIELDDRFGLARLFLGATYTEQFRYAEALTELEAAVRLSGPSPEVLAAIGYLHGRSGNVDGARRVLDDLSRLSRQRYVSPSRVAQVYLALGQRAEALDRLRAAHAERAADLAWLGVRPVFASLRTEPEYQAIVGAMGLGNR
jgi:eukaryotic-like serine/threonine-protein kinase